jgi:hypothetical protein
MGIPKLPIIYQSIIELILIMIIFFLSLKNSIYKKKYDLKSDSKSFLKNYTIYIFLCACSLDIIISTILNVFPMINFIFRCFLIIFLSKKLRAQWIKIIKIIWLTRNLFFILFLDLIFFTIMGHLLFTKVHEYSDFYYSFDTMLTMLTTNNFPDCMLNTFHLYSKFTIIFFLVYMLISYIIILALLKAVYYSNYFEILREDVIFFLNQIAGKNIFTIERDYYNELDTSFQSNNTEYFRNNNNEKLFPQEYNNNFKKNECITNNLNMNLTKDLDYDEIIILNISSNVSKDIINTNSNLNQNPNPNQNQNQNENEIHKIDDYNINLTLKDSYEENNINDNERRELLGKLKQINKNLSLTKKETKIIKKIINYSKDLVTKNEKKAKEKVYINSNSESKTNRDSISDNNKSENNMTFEEEKDKSNKKKILEKKKKEVRKFLHLENEYNYSKINFIKFSKKKTVEAILNILNLISIFFFIIYKQKNEKYIFLACLINIIFNIYFLFEFFHYSRFYKFTQIAKYHIFRFLFYMAIILELTLNLLIFFFEMAYYLNLLDDDFINGKFYKNILKVSTIFAVLRGLRIFIILRKNKKFYAIFTLIHNIRVLFSSILFTLISFCFIFITISMILFGGKIRRDRYLNNDKGLPSYYHYLNFNDYASGFLFCFATIVQNNMNLVFDDFSSFYGRYMKFYFFIFFFLGINVIVNIVQMIILEMYLNIKDTFTELNSEYKKLREKNKI